MTKNTIQITVKFFAMLREFGPKEAIITIPENSEIKILFDKYDIPKDARKAIIMVNGSPHRDLNTILNDGDIVSIFPPIGGG